MSHHGMHIPPQMLPMLGGVNPFAKMDKAKKKQRLKQTTSTEQTEDLDETDEAEENFRMPRSAARNPNQSMQDKTGARPQPHPLSDKVVKSLLQVQEGIIDKEI